MPPPTHTSGLLGLLNGWEPLDADFPEVEDPPARPEEIFAVDDDRDLNRR